MKKFLLLAITTLLAIPSFSQNMIVEMKDGKQSNSIVALDELQQITFSNSNVNIAVTDGSTLTAKMGDINRIYFGDGITVMSGDINGDGATDIADITTLVSFVLNTSLGTPEADINNDGYIDVSDITLLVSIILGNNVTAYANATTTQTLFLNNSNATNLEINTDEVKEITFNETQLLITIHGNDGAKSTFVTTKVNNISKNSNGGATLTYDSDKSIVFNEADATSYKEVVETIIKDELNDEYGDFIENYTTTKIIAISFSGTKVICNSTLSDVTYTITNNSHIVINSTRKNVGFLVYGKCDNGSVKIYSNYKFQLQLNNLTLTNPNGPAINIQSGKSVYLTLAKGTTNTLCDGETYTAAAKDANGKVEDQKGTIFSEGQLIFNGEGTLNVTSKGGHAICSDDYIRIRSGKINITSAAKDGFHTNDIFRVGRTATASPVITLNAQSDGIDCGKGKVLIEAGKITMNTGGEAINVSYEEAADPTITPDAIINGGYIKATTNDEKAAIVKTAGNFTLNGGTIQGEVKGNGSKIVNCDGDITIKDGKITGISYGTLSSDATTAGGFKSDGNTIIEGGTIALDSRGEGSKGFNCNGNLVINGGDITLLATADNFVADNDDRKTRAITAYDITINGGNIYTKAYDHAINATSLNFTAGSIQAFSSNSTAITGTTTQSGGWLLTKGVE